MTSIVGLAVRQVLANDTSDTSDANAKPQCGGGNLDPNADFNMGLHIGALFIIFATSTFGISPFLFCWRMNADAFIGAFFPILSKRVPALRIPNIVFVIAKFFGSGVIIATAFIHVSSFC